MIPFGKDYFYYNGEVYKKLKPDLSRKEPRWNLIDKQGKQHWITLSALKKIIDKIAQRAI